MSVVLITGTSTGIGLQTALAATRAGHTVVATLRSPDKAGVLREAGLDVRRLDVTEDVTDCVEVASSAPVSGVTPGRGPRVATQAAWNIRSSSCSPPCLSSQVPAFAR
ncbi:MAG: short-chain dehydrogenase/reductase [Actinomycetia bacterium]|nr:short-chain dehydrogenase/reductase [Actinomycetes bacterium]